MVEHKADGERVEATHAGDEKTFHSLGTQYFSPLVATGPIAPNLFDFTARA